MRQAEADLPRVVVLAMVVDHHRVHQSFASHLEVCDSCSCISGSLIVMHE